MMKTSEIFAVAMLGFCCSIQAFAAKVAPATAVADALKAYAKPTDAKRFTTVLRVAFGQSDDGSSQYRVVLALAPVGQPKPLGDWDMRTVRILQLDYGTNAALKTTSDITLAGLPQGSVDACFWIKMRDSNTAGGRACFPLTRIEDKLWIRLWSMGIYRVRIPWRKPDGRVIYTEMAPEECDGAFDDQEHAFGWCPWSAAFEGVFRDGSHAEGLFDLP